MLMLKGLFERTIRAYIVTLLSLGLCTIMTFLLGTTIRHTLWLVGMLLVLVLLRSQFNRYRYPLTKATIIVTSILMTLFLLSYAFMGYLLGEIHLEPAYASSTLSYAEFTTTLLTGIATALLLYSMAYFAFERHQREPLGRAWIPEDDALLQGPNGWLYRRLPGKRVFNASTGKFSASVPDPEPESDSIRMSAVPSSSGSDAAIARRPVRAGGSLRPRYRLPAGRRRRDADAA